MESYLQKFAGSKRSWLPEPDPADVELTAKRRRNDERHESRWSSIIERYSKDFTECGDEIDLDTGEIVVNNGHLARMRDEFDNGDGVPSSSQRLSDVVGHFITHNETDAEDETESVESEEDDLLPENASLRVEEDDHDEDELNSDWPIAGPQLQQPQRISIEPHIKSNSPSIDDQFEDVEQFADDTPSSSERQDAAGPMEKSELGPEPSIAPQAQLPSVLPQFQLPQLGLSGQLETAMQAMSTAMGAAIQAQMMAFMNVVLATRDTPLNPAVAPPATNGPPSLPLALPVGPPSHGAGPSDTSRATGNSNHFQPTTIRREHTESQLRVRDSSSTLSRRNDMRSQTPGFGSLWAVPGRKKRGRSKQSSLLRQPKPTQSCRPAERNSDVRSVTRASSSPHGRNSMHNESPLSPDTFPWAASASSPLPTISTPAAIIPAAGQTASEPQRRRDLSDSTTHHVPHTRNIPSTVTQLNRFNSPFIVDSDEDEISTLTPSSSTKHYNPSIATSKPNALTRNEPPDSARDSRRSSTEEDLSIEPAKNNRLPPLRPSHSRSGLRHKKASLNYNEIETFKDLLDGSIPDGDAYPRVERSKKIIATGTCAQQQNFETGQAGTVDNEPAESRQTLTALASSPSIEELSSDHTSDTDVGNAKQSANISLPRSPVYPRPPLHPWESSAGMDLAELEARYVAFSTRDKVNPIKYEARPPPLPCAHCKTTAATTWLLNPEGGVRRICNACAGYMRKHDGEKRPLTFEEYRSLKDKTLCDNCARLAVRDWDSIVSGKRLCKPCRLYTKMNNGTMRPVPRPKATGCDRCKNKVLKTFFLSNRARVCIDCHNILFADYVPENDLAAASRVEKLRDTGETFFDRCLLIYAYGLLASVPTRVKSLKNTPNAGGFPCKVCHCTTAANWRPALDNAMICEPCYNRVSKIIREQGLLQKLGEDGMAEIPGLKTSGFGCERCKDLIVGTKWRADAPGGGNIVCTPCFNESHKHVSSQPDSVLGSSP